jgi:hypothetical protein
LWKGQTSGCRLGCCLKHPRDTRDLRGLGELVAFSKDHSWCSVEKGLENRVQAGGRRGPPRGRRKIQKEGGGPRAVACRGVEDVPSALRGKGRCPA